MIRFDSNYRVESNFSDAGFVRNSFDSIRKFAIRLIRGLKITEKFDKNQFEIPSIRFDSTSNVAKDVSIIKTLNYFEFLQQIYNCMV